MGALGVVSRGEGLLVAVVVVTKLRTRQAAQKV